MRASFLLILISMKEHYFSKFSTYLIAILLQNVIYIYIYIKKYFLIIIIININLYDNKICMQRE